jgi:geranylgeranyl reductase family protein
MNQTRYDVLIVGAGPAGNTLAYKLANSGLSVVLIDKLKLPRRKICAGGISRKTFLQIGYDIDPVIEKTITGAYLTYRNDVIIHKAMNGVGATVERSNFDYFMTKKAVEAGATLLDETELVSFVEDSKGITARTSRGELHAGIIVGADGVYSKIRKLVYPDARPLFGHAIEALVYPQPDMLDAFGSNALFDFGGIKGGYGWIMPKKDHFNIGLFKMKNFPGNMDMRRHLDDFILRNRVIRDYRSIDVKGYPIPIRAVSRILTVKRAMLIGDAAGFGDSFYGEGIYYAAWSANCAHRAIKGYLINGEPLSRYNQYVRPIINNLVFSRMTARLFYGAARFGYFHMAKNEWVNEYYAQLIYGKANFMTCFFKTIVFFPLWIFAPRYKPIDDSHLEQ